MNQNELLCNDKVPPLSYQCKEEMDANGLLYMPQMIAKSEDIENERLVRRNFEEIPSKKFTDEVDIKHVPLEEIDINKLINVKNIKKEPIDGQIVIENDAFIAYINEELSEDVDIGRDGLIGGVAIKKEPLDVDYVVEIEVLMHEDVNQKESVSKENIKKEENKGIVLTEEGSLAGMIPFECNTCLRRFVRKGDLERHLRTHIEEILDEGKIRQRSYKPKDKHIQLQLVEEAFKCQMSPIENFFECTLCQRTYSQKSKLNNHFKLHTVKKPYKCQLCPKKFRAPSYLSRHVRIHTGEKPFKCDVCKKCFNQKGTLNNHSLIHTGEKPFKCDICQKCFRQKYYLGNHRRIHAEKKQFKCEKCQRIFNSKHIFLKHLLIHSSTKRFHIQRFRKRNRLTGNLPHTDEKYFECGICQRRFSLKRYLARHMITH